MRLDGFHELGHAVIPLGGGLKCLSVAHLGEGVLEVRDLRVFADDLRTDLGGTATDCRGLLDPARRVVDVEQARKGDGHIILQIGDIGVVADQFFGDFERLAVVPLGGLPLPGGLAGRTALDMGAEQGTTVSDDGRVLPDQFLQA